MYLANSMVNAGGPKAVSLDKTCTRVHYLAIPQGKQSGRCGDVKISQLLWSSDRVEHVAANDGPREAALPALEEPMGENRIPSTDSISELARFWDTHDLTDFDAELEAVEETVFVAEGPGHQLLVRLDDVEAATVRELARARGVDEATLVREWIRDHVPKAAG